MTSIKANELKQMQERTGTPPVINVLPAESFEKQRIPGSVNIPLESDDFVERVGGKVSDKSDPVVVYCANTECPASAKAAEKLEVAGFTQVQDFESGLRGWTDAGYDLEGTEAFARN